MQFPSVCPEIPVRDLAAGEWAAAGAVITDLPEAKPYEFVAADIDGNIFRVFHDVSWEEPSKDPN